MHHARPKAKGLPCGTLVSMNSLGLLKPLLTTLFLPPAGPLLLLALACLWIRRHPRTAQGLAIVAGVSLWVLSCQATAYGLNRWLLPSFAPPSAEEMAQAQAIVVLGGGVHAYAPEQDGPLLEPSAQARLDHGLWLRRKTHLPMLYAGGKGWRDTRTQPLSEAEVAAASVSRAAQPPIQWLDTRSRDTYENAQEAFRILAPLNKTRVLLVTHDWHMARSKKQFESAGFTVVPAPMGYTQPPDNLLFDCLPSSSGLQATHRVLRDWLGLWLT